jgi:putative serine protease PepD
MKKHASRAAALIASAAIGAALALGALIAAEGTSDSSTPATSTVVAGTASPAAVTTSPKSVAAIYAGAVSGVVEIKVRENATGQSITPFGPTQQAQLAQGTGFEIDSNGDIATNAHVVSGASSITVQTHDGETYKATLVGTDPTTDVAVIHIDAPSADLHPLTFGDSTSLRVGDAVIAIGDPFGLADSVSTGIVSALDRTITSPNDHPIANAIQTDAAINHGNSGGPLLNAQGQVIGITSQIYADGSTSGNVGIGFAVPSSTVQGITGQLIASGKATHAYLGVYLQDASGGARITKVTSGSPAAAAGLTAREVITAIDGQRVADASAAAARIAGHKPGDSVRLTVVAGTATHQITVTLGSVS